MAQELALQKYGKSRFFFVFVVLLLIKFINRYTYSNTVDYLITAYQLYTRKKYHF